MTTDDTNDDKPISDDLLDPAEDLLDGTAISEDAALKAEAAGGSVSRMLHIDEKPDDDVLELDEDEEEEELPEEDDYDMAA